VSEKQVQVRLTAICLARCKSKVGLTKGEASRAALLDVIKSAMQVYATAAGYADPAWHNV
jgi:hypothetical protein